MSTGKRMCSNIVIAMRFKDFQLTTSSTGINTEFKNTNSVIKTTNNFIYCNKVTLLPQTNAAADAAANDDNDDNDSRCKFSQEILVVC